jgi:hypothetical protein
MAPLNPQSDLQPAPGTHVTTTADTLGNDSRNSTGVNPAAASSALPVHQNRSSSVLVVMVSLDQTHHLCFLTCSVHCHTQALVAALVGVMAANIDVSIDVNIGPSPISPWTTFLGSCAQQIRSWFRELDKNQMGAIILCMVGAMYYFSSGNFVEQISQRLPATRDADTTAPEQQHPQHGAQD